MKTIELKTEVVVNKKFGGYDLSLEAQKEIAKRKGWETKEKDGYLYVVSGESSKALMYVVPRNDPDLITVVRRLGKMANGDDCRLEIVEVTSFIYIEDYDGKESVSVSGSYID